jgi:hypothetical protein
MGDEVEGNDDDQLTENWEILVILLEALLSLYPSDEDIAHALPEIPPAPNLPTIRRPSREKFRRSRKYGSIEQADQAYKAANTRYGAIMADYRKQKKDYHSSLPELVRRYKLWKSLKGDPGKVTAAKRVIHSRLKLLRRFQDGTAGPESTRLQIQTLPWELLPVGDWDLPWLAGWLRSKARRGDRIEEQRLLHLKSLSPLAIYRSNAFSDRGYLAFVFGQDGPTALESAIHGNATYVLLQDWKPLSRLTKRELFSLQKNGDERVSRLVHHNLDDWRYDVCRSLKIRIPSHSNEY